MESAEQVISRKREQLLGTKESGSGGNTPQAAGSLPVTSETGKCPFGLCDGSGIIWVPEQNGGYPCRCMELQNMEKKLSFAHIPKEFSHIRVNDFDIERYQEAESRQVAYTAKKVAIRYIEGFAEMERLGKGLYFYSRERGSGKTMLMAGIGNALTRVHGKRVRFATLIDLLEEIRRTFDASSGETYSEMLHEIREVDILLLDDIGAERPTEWAGEVFYNILNRRMAARKITFFTSNLKMEELPYHGRLLARIDKMAMPVKFPEESVRRQMSRQENEEMMKFLMAE